MTVRSQPFCSRRSSERASAARAASASSRGRSRCAQRLHPARCRSGPPRPGQDARRRRPLPPGPARRGAQVGGACRHAHDGRQPGLNRLRRRARARRSREGVAHPAHPSSLARPRDLGLRADAADRDGWRRAPHRGRQRLRRAAGRRAAPGARRGRGGLLRLARGGALPGRTKPSRRAGRHRRQAGVRAARRGRVSKPTRLSMAA